MKKINYLVILIFLLLVGCKKEKSHTTTEKKVQNSNEPKMVVKKSCDKFLIVKKCLKDSVLHEVVFIKVSPNIEINSLLEYLRSIYIKPTFLPFKEKDYFVKDGAFFCKKNGKQCSSVTINFEEVKSDRITVYYGCQVGVTGGQTYIAYFKKNLQGEWILEKKTKGKTS